VAGGGELIGSTQRSPHRPVSSVGGAAG
jgi:hypothetical protein